MSLSVSGDHRPGGAVDPADPGERRAEPAELLPVQTAGRADGGERGATAAQSGCGPSAQRGGRQRDAPQQPETGRVNTTTTHNSHQQLRESQTPVDAAGERRGLNLRAHCR